MLLLFKVYLHSVRRWQSHRGAAGPAPYVKYIIQSVINMLLLVIVMLHMGWRFAVPALVTAVGDREDRACSCRPAVKQKNSETGSGIPPGAGRKGICSIPGFVREQPCGDPLQWPNRKIRLLRLCGTFTDGVLFSRPAVKTSGCRTGSAPVRRGGAGAALPQPSLPRVICGSCFTGARSRRSPGRCPPSRSAQTRSARTGRHGPLLRRPAVRRTPRGSRPAAEGYRGVSRPPAATG
ncbi:MAG: hypothetical protein PWR21_700 [Methanoculleus sp.]|nr:hypothetical protein [Methanoculleus sp.]MDK2989005.1 hypothetical protein [Methanoculleus sp.]